MAAKKIKEVIAGLKTVLKKIIIADGYSLTLTAANIREQFSRNAMENQDDSQYPKVFVMVDDGGIDEEVSSRARKHLNFLVILVLKRTAENDVPQDRLNDFVDDVDKVISLNTTLDNTVEDASVTYWNVDGGVCDPEAIGIVRIEALYDFYR